MSEECDTNISTLRTDKEEVLTRALMDGFTYDGKTYDRNSYIHHGDINVHENSIKGLTSANYFETNYGIDTDILVALSKFIGNEPLFVNEFSASADGGLPIGRAIVVHGDDILIDCIHSKDCKDSDYLDENREQDDDKWYSHWDDLCEKTVKALEELVEFWKTQSKN